MQSVAIHLDRAGRIVAWDARAAAMFGIDREHAVGRSVATLIAPDAFSEVAEMLEPEDTKYARVIRAVGRDGSEFAALINVVPWPGNPAAADPYALMLVTNTDREATRFRRALVADGIVESAADAILAKDLDSRIVMWNKACEQLYGHAARDVIGLPLDIIIPSDRAGEHHRLIELVAAGKTVRNFRTTRIRRDGQRVKVELTLSPCLDEQGSLFGVSCIARPSRLESA